MYGRRQRWAWAFADLASARLSLSLGGVLLLIECAIRIVASGSEAGVDWIYETFGLSRATLLSGCWWQLGTHGLIHGGVLHAALNATTLALAGSRVERIGGASAVAKLFVAGIFLGGVFHLLLPDGRERSLLVGASGGVFALVLFLTTLSPQSRMWPVPVSAKNLGIGLLVASGVLALAAPWLGDDPLRTAHACHFGGAVSGWLIARHVLRPRVTLAHLQKERARRESANGPP